MAILLYAGTCNSAAFYVAGWLSGHGMEVEDIWMKISGNKEIVGAFLFTYYGLDIERPVYGRQIRLGMSDGDVRLFAG